MDARRRARCRAVFENRPKRNREIHASTPVTTRHSRAGGNPARRSLTTSCQRRRRRESRRGQRQRFPARARRRTIFPRTPINTRHSRGGRNPVTTRHSRAGGNPVRRSLTSSFQRGRRWESRRGQRQRFPAHARCRTIFPRTRINTRHSRAGGNPVRRSLKSWFQWRRRWESRRGRRQRSPTRARRAFLHLLAHGPAIQRRQPVHIGRNPARPPASNIHARQKP